MVEGIAVQGFPAVDMSSLLLFADVLEVVHAIGSIISGKAVGVNKNLG
jgi:hypothetical protein